MSSINHRLDTYKTLFLVKGILNCVFSLFFVMYIFMGGFFTSMMSFADGADEIPFNFGYIFIFVGSIGFILSIAFGITTIMASNFIKERRKYDFIFIIAILNAITGVLGILLCVFTLLELQKSEVRELFGKE